MGHMVWLTAVSSGSVVVPFMCRTIPPRSVLQLEERRGGSLPMPLRLFAGASAALQEAARPRPLQLPCPQVSLFYVPC